MAASFDDLPIGLVYIIVKELKPWTKRRSADKIIHRGDSIEREHNNILRWFQISVSPQSPPTLDEEFPLKERNSGHHYHSDSSGADQLSQYPILLRIGSHRTKICQV